MRRLLLLLPALAAALLLGGPAFAEAPFRLADRITDRVGVLDPADRQRVAGAVERLRAEEGVDLFVVYVAGFDGADGQAWADRAAMLSQLGADDVLLAVAVTDRAYGTSYDQDFRVPGSTTARIDRDEVEPRLAADDWAGAAVALADGLSGATGGGGDAGLATAAAIAVVGGTAVVGVGAVLLARRRRRGTATGPDARPTAPAGPPDPFPGVDTADLAHRSSTALIEVDDAVRTSETELLAARGHFGDEAVAGFAAAVEESRADMLAAFALRQQLDDDMPEDEPAQRALHAEILRLCARADERLDAQVEAFDRLRGLEARAPEYVDGLGTRLDAVRDRLPRAEVAWTALQARWAPSALEPLAGDLDHARTLLAAATTEVGEARRGLAGATPAAAVVSGRAAEDALTQAEALLDAVERREGELVAAAARIPAVLADVEQDLAEARALPGTEPLVARAEAAVRSAEGMAADDPLAALRLLDEATAALDTALAEGREAAERSRRAAAALDQALVTARASVAAAEDVLATRRGAVGTAARTRLATARTELQHALAGGDPVAGLAAAQRADALAREALGLAQDDVRTWSDSGGGALAGELGGLVLGGILSGALRGGGYRGGSGGFGGGFGGGGRSPGSFGGTASRGRRGGGGRF